MMQWRVPDSVLDAAQKSWESEQDLTWLMCDDLAEQTAEIPTRDKKQWEEMRKQVIKQFR